MIKFKKRILLTICIFFASSIFSSPPLHSQEVSKGVTIDIARKHYSLKSLKEIVRTIHDNNGDYIQVHFSNDENYAIESDFIERDDTSQNYLTKQEVKALINYSNQYNIMVVPDMNFPAHSKAWLDFLKADDKDLYNDIISDYSDNTLDFFNNDKALETSKKRTEEILKLFEQPQFKSQQRIVLGGDEVPGGIANQKEFITFMNDLGDYVDNQGYEPQMWNDSITDEGLKLLSDSYSILYWQQKSYGDEQFTSSVDDFINHDFDVYNYNSDSLYFIPSPNFDEATIQQQVDYINKTYQYNKFYFVTDFHKEVESTHVQGSALTFWGENSSNMTEEELLKQELPLIKAYLQKSE